MELVNYMPIFTNWVAKACTQAGKYNLWYLDAYDLSEPNMGQRPPKGSKAP